MSRDIFFPLSPTLNLKLAAVQSSLVCSTGKSGGYRGGARGARLTLFLDQTEARRAEILFVLKDWPPLSQGLDDSSPPPTLSEGLDPLLDSNENGTFYLQSNFDYCI